MTQADVPVAETCQVLAPELFVEPDTVVPGAAARLAASRCGACSLVQFPARERCPECHLDTEAVELSGPARISGWTEVLHAVPGSALEPPYYVCIASFDAGISILGILLMDGGAGLGEEIESVALRLPDGGITFAFAPCRASASNRSRQTGEDHTL